MSKSVLAPSLGSVLQEVLADRDRLPPLSPLPRPRPLGIFVVCSLNRKQNWRGVKVDGVVKLDSQAQATDISSITVFLLTYI